MTVNVKIRLFHFDVRETKSIGECVAIFGNRLFLVDLEEVL
jgi:hypothetical protein